MEPSLVVTILCSVGILVIAGISWAAVYRKNHRAEAPDVLGDRKAARALAACARRNGGKVLNGVSLSLDGETVRLDDILIAPFGVLVVEAKNWAGTVYCNPNEAKWLQVLGDDRLYHDNPLLENRDHLESVRKLFREENIYRTTVEGAVVCTGARPELYVPRTVPVYTVKQFKKLLKKPAYLADNKVDVEKVYQAIVKHQIAD